MEKRYIPEINVLRAFAIIAVVASHVTPAIVEGGFLGVDIFFVISGFLITYSNLHGKSSGDFSMMTFWSRRISRIIPALLCVTLFSSVLANYILVLQEDYNSYFGSLLYQSIFIQNFFFAKEGMNYFLGLQEAKLNLHLWSIAIEEQFYIFFPIVVIAAFSFKRRHAWNVLGVIVFCAFLLSLLAQPGRISMAYYLTQFRVWQLCMGVIIALIAIRFPLTQLPVSPRWALIVEIIGIAMLVIPIVFATKHLALSRVIMLIPCTGTAGLIILAVIGKSAILRAVSKMSAINNIGRASYSLYLWHWPIFSALKYLDFDFGTRFSDLAAYFFMLAISAGASFVVLENKLRPLAYKWAFLLLPVFVFINLALTSMPFTPSKQHAPMVGSILKSAARYAKPCSTAVCEHGSGERIIILWGDSHAMAIWSVMKEIADDSHHKLIGVFGCMPGRRDIERCKDRYETVSKLYKTGKVDVVLLVARWSVSAVGFPKFEPEEYGRRFFKHRGLEAKNQQEMGHIWKTAMDDLLLENQGMPFYVLLQVPQFAFFPNKEAITSTLGLRLRDLPQKTLEEHRHDHRFVNDYFYKISETNVNVQLIDPADVLCKSGVCAHQIDGLPLYSDDDHLSVKGGETLKILLRDVAK